MLDSNGKLLCRTFYKRVRSDRDVVIALTGDEGEGKSNCAIQIAKESSPSFDIETDEVGSTLKQELQEKILDKKKYCAIVVDEAIKRLYKQNWQSKSQRFLNQLYTLCRQENKITVLCLPRFIDLNEFFRNHRVKFWIHIVQRGTAVVFMKDWSPFTKDPWWMVENQKIIDIQARNKSIVDIDVNLKVKILSKSKNFLLSFTFSDFDPEDKEKYLQYVGSNKYGNNLDAEDVTETPTTTKVRGQRDKLIVYLAENHTQRAIAKLLGITSGSVSDVLVKAKKERDLVESISSDISNQDKQTKKLNFLHR